MSSLQKEQYIELAVGAETCAIRIEEIHEIIKMLSITDIPFSRNEVKGVVNLRGKVVCVMSLRNLLGMADEPYTRSTRIIVVNYREEFVGLIVDKVNKVTTYAEIHPPAGGHNRSRDAVFHGVGQRDDQLIGILKLEEILGG
ncbi:chemotaxis protein CheW [Paenibacillus sp. FSL R7-0204]|uniref:Purine-binding chemotaxis protein CheW n=1 Tax=Paenibacillus silagei TaxID=1670801 RepID=A0ABS4NKZ5_9BACL|nr:MULTISPECIES: chemotaxis protein CheW [Paenibacillus]OMF84932.1 chemotaxis protein CheW [Paenibacillus sp. FSL R7-0333]ETT34147.1 CheW protein [Paenibacillus sp. FSL R7-269]ETT57692.1 CheW protein [Paenibacillus sp. FSL R7-277]MBP2110713.1 purine-binding chemotaxis protein CheW [Paenibacillus silagei]OMF96471.1 chemotaxis protein CheW [Paenibacillus sp. FSL R7-0337]